MAKRVILAVAGAGKTYYICHEIDPTKRNLILAFTHENIHNIQKELCDAHGCVPELTTVSTFDSFVYHQMILPYEPSIAEHFGCPKFVSSASYTFHAMNWSYSKGDTVNSACVILTDGLDNLDSESFDPEKVKLTTLNKLYVAMTRSRGDLYLIKASTFKKLKDAYIAH